MKVEIYQINTIQSPKNGNNYILNLLSSQKLISLKNLSNRNKNVQRFLWPILAKLDNLAHFVRFEKTVYNFALYILTISSCEEGNVFVKLVACNFTKNFNFINANTIFNKAWWKMGLVN